MKLVIRLLGPVEILLTIATVCGMFFRIMHLPGGVDILLISMSLLSVVYFLRAFIPVDIPRDENEPFNFFDLLALVIAPKVIWIASAVATFGIMGVFLHFAKPEQALLAGSLAIVIAIVISGIYLSSHPYTALIKPLYRAVPIALLSLYLLMNNPS